MKDILKIALIILALAATYLFTLFIVMSFLTWRKDGMFWYGIGLILSGTLLKISLKWF